MLAQATTGGFIFSVGQDGRLIDISATQGDPDASTDLKTGDATGPGDRLFLFSNRLQDEADAETAPRAPVPAPPEILAAIEATAFRYAGHPGLRRAGLSVTDWAALYRANIEIESAYNPRALSGAGAIGLGQLMPDTAQALGVDPHDTRQNLDGSARYLLMMLDRFGDSRLALAAYNAGPEAVDRHGGIPPYRETMGHVAKVTAAMLRLRGEIS
ncbi:lytic transglycosylase domain-containing protein [Puniceibacterium confluentis]|uniref:lytic transglycosylase domain-containing protein n=1 Tax=Puniceibacterium confluentis TaxID=1958944 RepID=UPI00319DC052